MEFAFQIIFLCQLVLFLSCVFMHLIKENATLIGAFLIQTIAVSVALTALGIAHGAEGLVIAALFTILIKAIIAPLFFFRLIRRHQLKASGSTYVSVPTTLSALVFLTLFANSQFFTVITPLIHVNASFLGLSLASLLISLFLMINRKGALSQIIGILAFENGIVLFASLMNLEQTVGLEFGIAFDLLAWIIIAAVFVSLIHKHFGSLDVTELSTLKES